jgi:hypothetical protein
MRGYRDHSTPEGAIAICSSAAPVTHPRLLPAQHPIGGVAEVGDEADAIALIGAIALSNWTSCDAWRLDD